MQLTDSNKGQSAQAQDALEILKANHYEPTAEDFAEAHAAHTEMEFKQFYSLAYQA